MDTTIKKLKKCDLPDALLLVRRVFDEFEAPNYPQEGLDEFYQFIEESTMAQMISKGELVLWGSYDKDTILGVIAVRVPDHISLLFVDGQHHRQGIAKVLYHTYLQQYHPTCVTVNSSIYAVPAYKKLGFVATGSKQIKNGITFVPMVDQRYN